MIDIPTHPEKGMTKLTLVLLGVMLSGIAMVAFADDRSSGRHRAAAACDRQAAAVAAAVRNQALPDPQAGLFFQMVMREAKVPPADHRIYYGAHTLQFGDLRLPKGRGPHPVAIVIHGGGWDAVVNLHYVSHIAEYLTCLGIATWNIEYRRLNANGEWPAMFNDIGAAADYLRVLATRYPLDLRRVISIGHSAGGHFALWQAGRHRLAPTAELFIPNPLPINGVVSLDGTPNLIKWGLAGGAARVALVAQILGGGSEEQRIRRNREASPEELLPLGVPQVFISGDTFRLAHIKEHVVAANASGDDVQLVHLPGGDHFDATDVVNPITGPAVRDSVLRFLGMTARGDGRDDDDD